MSWSREQSLKSKACRPTWCCRLGSGDVPGDADPGRQLNHARASRRLMESSHRPLALNFANGIHPGGGFLAGARAQKEVLCRSTALYRTLVGDAMYDAHRKRPRPDSTDWAIYSPDVPVFRKDDGTELDRPWLLSFITCAAPYAPKIGQPESGDLCRSEFIACSRSRRYSTTRPFCSAHGAVAPSATTLSGRRSISAC